MGGAGRIEGRVFLDGGWSTAAVSWEDGRISSVEPSGRDADGPLLVPGFVDLHCHGGGGADVMQAGEAVHQIARTHAAHGTAAFLATTMTAPLEEVEEALAAVARAMEKQGEDEAKILGVHLEGPFISPDQLGAQPPFAIPATVPLLERLCGLAPIRVITMAPEADPSGEVAAFLRGQGVRVQIGHTSAGFETSKAFILGNHGVTHMFNAMGGFHHRKSGCPGAALAHAEHAEIIADLHHADKGSILAARRAIPKLYAVTDATAASGMPDGAYKLGQYEVFRRDGTVRLASGGLAGSCLTMDGAFQNLVSIGLPPEEAALRTSTIAAAYVGAQDYGAIRPGARASFVAVAGDGGVQTVVHNGRMLR